MTTPTKKPLSFESLVQGFKDSWTGHDDQRRQNSIGYSVQPLASLFLNI